MPGNSNLHIANKNKKDEFYTQLVDIEAELKHYRGHFADKIVFCNCDDPYESNFFKYFAMNFNYLGLKKLIATCYAGSSVVGEQFIRVFTDNEKMTMYERQKGICPKCRAEGKKAVWKFEEMHADHKIPWCRGGHTTLENGQMLCREHNLEKSYI